MAKYKHAQKTNATSVLVKILIVLLILILLGGIAFAVYHFFIAKEDKPKVETVPSVASEATLQPPPTVAPTEDAQTRYNNLAKNYLNGMSEREKICQMLVVSPESLTGVDVVTEAGDLTKEAIASYPVGGVVYSDDNLESAQQTKELIQNTQSYSKTPMFIAAVEEGGDDASVSEKLPATKLENMNSYKDEGELVAYNNAVTLSKNIKEYGFNLDFAPVCDIWSNPNSTVIGDRSYGSDANTVSELISKAVEGFHSENMICTLKHFPGIGDSTQDSQTESLSISKTEEELNKTELLPFKSGIEAGADMVLVSHAKVDNIDKDLPASLSQKVISEMLIKQLKFNGIVITDALDEDEITDNYSTDDIVVNAINAGVNILLMPDDIEEYITAIETAIKDGKIKQSAIDESVTKILALKFKYNIIKEPTPGLIDATSPASTAPSQGSETTAPSAETTPVQ